MESTRQSHNPDADPPRVDSSSRAVALCGNCGQAAAGAYCHDCGQRFLGDRLSIRELWNEFSRQFLHLERGFLVTVIDMIKSPGKAIRRYVYGGRRRYVNPVTFLLLCTTISVLFSSLVQDQIVEFIAQTYENQGIAEIMSEEGMAKLTEIQGRIYQYQAYISLAACLPSAFLMHLFFGRSHDLRFVEAMVFNLYCFGLVAILALPNTLLMATTDVSLGVIAVIGYILYMGTGGWAAWGFFARSKSAVLLSMLGIGISYFSVTMVLGIIMFLFVMFTT